jgi:hypothetical protein
MLAALVLASIWAQAEPPPPVPPPPPAPPVEEPPPALANALTVVGQVATRVRIDEQALPPRNGFCIGGSFERRLLVLGPAVELGAAVDFLYDHFENTTTGPPGPGGAPTITGSDVISDTSFALLATAAMRAGALRPFAAAGGGLTVGYFSTSDSPLNPGSTTAVQPVARVALGLDAALSRTFALVARVDYTLAFTRPAYTPPMGAPYSLFGDVVHIGAGVVARF